MSVTYINISSTSCDSYASLQPTLPGPTSTFYMNSGNAYLKSSDYRETNQSNVVQVNFSDYAFKAFTTQTLLSTPADANKRYLERSTATSTDSSSSKLATGTSPNWLTSLPTSVTFTPTGGSSKSYNLATTAVSGLRNLLLQVVPAASSYSSGGVPNFVNVNYIAPTTISFSGVQYQSNGLLPKGGDSGTIQTGTSGLFPRFYLRRIPTGGSVSSDFRTSEVYYRCPGGIAANALEIDIADAMIAASNVSANLSHQFTIRRYTVSGTDGTDSENSALAIFTGDATPVRVTDLTLNWNGTNLTVTSGRFPSSTYILDISDPQDNIASGVYTLFRNVSTGRYVYWSGYNANTPANSSNTLVTKDYWTNALTPQELSMRTIFLWDDLTPSSTTTVNIISGSKVDIYRWKTQLTLNNLPTFIYYTKNPNDDGGNLIFTNVPPPANEGWAVIYNTSDANNTVGGFIGYIRNNKVIALMDSSDSATGNLPLTANASGISISSSTNAAWRYRCIRCSSLSTTPGSVGLCAS